MSNSLLIIYKQPEREHDYFAFCGQTTLTTRWWPLAEKLGLTLMQRLQTLSISERDEAIQFLQELRAARAYLQEDHNGTMDAELRAYLIDELDIVIPPIEQAISRWEEVDHLSF